MSIMLHKPAAFFVLNLLIISFLSGCGSAFIAARQDDIITQVDMWASENEYAKALTTIAYVKKSHPQYSALQIRRQTLLAQALDYQQQIDQQVKLLIQQRRWAQALDLLDEAKKKYPQGKSLPETEHYLLSQQQKALAVIEQKIMLARSQWMARNLPVYDEKLNTDPRNKALQKQLRALHKEAAELAAQLTIMAQNESAEKHYKTARLKIEQAIALENTAARQQLLAQLKKHSRKSSKQQKKKRRKTHKKQQISLLQEIQSSYSAGDFLKTRRLIQSLDDNERSNIQLIQLEQELERSINYAIRQLLADANRSYTNGEFHKAIALWQQVLIYDPQHVMAKKNIQRAEKVIDKLNSLREKQQN